MGRQGYTMGVLGLRADTAGPGGDEMAQYTMSYQCGHTEGVQLYGPAKDREWRLKAARERECKDCARKSHEGDNTEAAVLSRVEGLPRLVGTPSQVSYAESVRRTKIAELDALMAQVAAAPQAQEEPSLLRLYGKLADLVRRQPEARYWLDGRNSSAQYLLQQANKGLGR